MYRQFAHMYTYITVHSLGMIDYNNISCSCNVINIKIKIENHMNAAYCQLTVFSQSTLFVK